MCEEVCEWEERSGGVYVIKTRRTFNMQRSTITHLPRPCRRSHFSIRPRASLCVCMYVWRMLFYINDITYVVLDAAEADRRPVDVGVAVDKEHSLSWRYTLPLLSLSLIGPTGYVPLEDVCIPV